MTTSEAATSKPSSVADHPVRDPAVRFVGAAIGFLAVFASIYLVFVSTEPGQRLENAALRAATLRDEANRADSLTYLSGVSVASFLGAMAVIGLVAVARGRPIMGTLAVAVMAVSAAAAEILKLILTRPELVDGPAWILRNSFPSGTATVAASVGIGALLVAPDRLRWVVLLAAAALAALIGQATQVTGWHRASDALGGVVLSAGIACVALVALARIDNVQPSRVGLVHRRIFALTCIAALAAVAIGVAILGLFLAFPLLRAPAGAESVALHTASDLIVFGLSILTIAAFAWVIQPFTLGTSIPPTPGTATEAVLEEPGGMPRDETAE